MESIIALKPFLLEGTFGGIGPCATLDEVMARFGVPGNWDPRWLTKPDYPLHYADGRLQITFDNHRRVCAIWFYVKRWLAPSGRVELVIDAIDAYRSVPAADFKRWLCDNDVPYERDETLCWDGQQESIRTPGGVLIVIDVSVEEPTVEKLLLTL